MTAINPNFFFIADELLMPTRDVGNMLGTACTSTHLEKMKSCNFSNWTEIIPRTQLNPGVEETRHNYFEIDSSETWTHLRLNIYPDGGIARLRVYGEAQPTWEDLLNKEIDLLAMENGGVCTGYSNAHFGHPRNLIRKGRGVNMGDGWETARRLDRPEILETDSNGCLIVPGNEWALFRLGVLGNISRIVVDTNHFKGNYPDSVQIEGAIMKPSNDFNSRNVAQATWIPILGQTKLRPHHVHELECESQGPFSHVRITMAPDGGISRVRLFGQVSAQLPR